VDAGSTYTYTVVARDAANNASAPSNPATATTSGPAPTAPDAPTALTATGTDTQVALSWTAPASNGGSAITGYKIYRSTTTGAETFLKSVGVVTSSNDTAVTNGTTYYYKVSAVNSVGESVMSGEAFATPSVIVPAPGVPTAVTATRGDTSVTVNWSPPASDGGSAITAYTV